jgi:hypothetical protein
LFQGQRPVLEGNFKEGDHITAVMKGGKVVFEKG